MAPGRRALEAAGIRPIWPARPPGTVAERIAAARRLERDGLGVHAIADAIEVRPETVRRYLKAHPCRSCGDPVVGDARLCQEEFGDWPPAGVGRIVFGGWSLMLEAAGVGANKPSWEPQAILAAMREFRREVDRRPRPSDWQTACEDWPAAYTVRNRLGSWEAALARAAADPAVVRV
ncbi:MAG: hypothetical protein JSS97_10165 [Actinobacteria bacterium]|nr:hypothetical protein [Actinomycetota bacterium]